MTKEMLDYAMPLMKMERWIREIYGLCIERKYEEARELTIHLGVENRILQATLALVEEQEKQQHATEISQTHDRGTEEVQHQG